MATPWILEPRAQQHSHLESVRTSLTNFADVSLPNLTYTEDILNLNNDELQINCQLIYPGPSLSTPEDLQSPTEFARAKGSKASNEKTPEDSTPWEVMKEQLSKAKQENEDAKKRHEAEQQRIENYENFLKEQKIQKRKAEWCEFPGLNDSKKTKRNNNYKDQSKNKKNKVPLTSKDLSGEEKDTKIPEAISLSLDSTEHSNEASLSNKKKNKKQKSNKAEFNNTDSKATNPDSQNVNIKKTSFPNNEPKTKEKNKKSKDSQPQRRKPVTEKSFQLIINGKEIELVRYDGFPVMKKDADRLEQLKNGMMKKGIPKSEVQRTMKLERRRAEKALARMKRDVCYNCRKGGHNLSDCPDLKSKIPGVDAAEGVCFKCGSTEHRQFECKVQRDKEFRFATCFICKEPGHIARQCPDNPKGLYPNGGCCKLCGDVTHLRKDCPTVMDKKEETSVKLQTLDSAENIEDIGHDKKNNTITDTARKPKKIKF